MKEAQEGDRAAYDHLLRELLPVLRAFIRSRVGSAATAEDLVQDILLALHRSRHTYLPDHPFGPWLRSISRNVLIDYFRAQARRAPRGLHPTAGEALVSQGASLDDEELSEALAALPKDQREAVILLQVEELSVHEAAERIGISPSALKVRAHRGYQALRARLSRRSL